MGLFDFLRYKKKESLFKGKVFYYHEDAYCMEELIPVESIGELKTDFESIEKINEENKSQFGFSEIHVIEEKKVKLIDRKISIAELEEILKESSLIKFDNVTTGYGSMQYDSEFSTAFGLQDDLILVYERNQKLVDKIWFSLAFNLENEEYIKKFTEVVSLISKKWDLVLVYWYDPITINSQDVSQLTEFLKKN